MKSRAVHLGDCHSLIGQKAAEVSLFLSFHHVHLQVPLQLAHPHSQLWCQNIWDFKLRAKGCQESLKGKI